MRLLRLKVVMKPRMLSKLKTDDNAGADQDESDQDGGPRVNGVNPDEGHESSDMDADD